MGILIALKSIKANGELVHAGETFRSTDSQKLIIQGYARRLTKDEAQTILKKYVEYAESLFTGELPKKEVTLKIPTKAVDQGVLF